MNAKVTIIVPVYNTADYLQNCIDSIKNINFDSYQVIFIDNYSNDGSYEILKKNHNKKFIIIRNKKNYGQSYSLNKALRLAKSPYIAIMDSDDICLKNRIIQSYEFLKKNKQYALVAGRSNIINEKGKLIRVRRFTYNPDLINCRIFVDNPISHTTIMFKKLIIKKLGGYSKNLKFTQDFDLISKVLLNKHKIKILNKQLTLVRKHKKQQSFKNSKKQDLEKYKIVLRNIEKKIKLNIHSKSLIKFIILKKDKKFENFSSQIQINIFHEFLKKLFKNEIQKLYYSALIFSQKNNFKKRIVISVLIKYLISNKFIIRDKETLLRLGKSFLKIIF
jgi:glycosyltransferase involved in cell wall biosynthesis